MDSKKPLIYLHIPHTAGRIIRRFLWNNELLDTIHYTHNESDTKKISDVDWAAHVKYFVKRPVIERVIAQYLHYGPRLANSGSINHLSKKELDKDFDSKDPYQFVKLENNKNLYCKFILGSTNLAKPITDVDFEKVVTMIPTLHWDEFCYPMKVPEMERLMGRELDIKSANAHDTNFPRKTADRNVLLADAELCELIKKENSYDEKLFQLL